MMNLINFFLEKGPIELDETVDFERVIDDVLFTPEKVRKTS
jgi:hypothetical protein